MKAVLTRVKQASVTVDGRVVGSIDGGTTGGVLALVGVGKEDDPDAWQTMVRKIAELRLLDGERSAEEAGAPILVVSQFTLMGATKKGRRPSWINAAPAESAEPVMSKIVGGLRDRGLVVETGEFGAMMEVSSINDGPFTLLVES